MIIRHDQSTVSPVLAAIQFAGFTTGKLRRHPLGDPTPSREDSEITKRLKPVSNLTGVRVPDHIIIGNGVQPGQICSNS